MFPFAGLLLFKQCMHKAQYVLKRADIIIAVSKARQQLIVIDSSILATYWLMQFH